MSIPGYAVSQGVIQETYTKGTSPALTLRTGARAMSLASVTIIATDVAFNSGYTFDLDIVDAAGNTLVNLTVTGGVALAVGDQQVFSLDQVLTGGATGGGSDVGDLLVPPGGTLVLGGVASHGLGNGAIIAEVYTQPAGTIDPNLSDSLPVPFATGGDRFQGKINP